MSPAAILATADAAITVYEHAMHLLAQARAEGTITAEEQQARMARVADSRVRVGLPPVEPDSGVGG